MAVKFFLGIDEVASLRYVLRCFATHVETWSFPQKLRCSAKFILLHDVFVPVFGRCGEAGRQQAPSRYAGSPHAARIPCFAVMDKRFTYYLVGHQVTRYATSLVVNLELLTAHPRDEVFQS